MKYFPFLALLILCAGCNKVKHVEFTGTTPGLKSGTFIIKNLRDSTLYGVNIKDEKFQVSGILPGEGYYAMDIIDDADKSSHDRHFEVYLEDGKYTIATEAGKLFKYPKITSSSKIQNDLSAYYGLLDQQQTDNTSETGKVKARLAMVDSRTHRSEEHNAEVNKLVEINNRENAASFEALKMFVKQIPQSGISAHLMNKLNYDEDPVKYYEVYKTFSPDAKNSAEGKEIGNKLSNLVKLVPGAQSPVIVGKTPEGKVFDPASIKKKVILIDFWRAVNQVGRLNHQEMQSLITQFKPGEFGIVSVSIDSKADWWTGAIKEDKMTWPQVSDLKGDDSQNAANWAIKQIPTYCLVDGNWKIIARDIQLMEVQVYVNEYLSKH